MYALMLVDRADLLGEYKTREEADEARIRVIAADRGLTDIAQVIEMDDQGRPVDRPERAALA
jgi:hypothetical protein